MHYVVLSHATPIFPEYITTNFYLLHVCTYKEKKRKKRKKMPPSYLGEQEWCTVVQSNIVQTNTSSMPVQYRQRARYNIHLLQQFLKHCQYSELYIFKPSLYKRQILFSVQC